MVESNQKASLRVLKSLNEFEFGKRAFEVNEGSKVLSETLNTILQSPEGPSSSLTSIHSVASLLVAALRSAAGHSDIPFYELFKLRTFPIPDERQDRQDMDYEALVDECAQFLVSGEYPSIPNPPELIEDLVRLKMRRLCPELSYMDGRAIPKCEAPSSNISVRHVQPMAPGKHFVCKNHIPTDPEALLKRSPTAFRKILFDQTARMFESTQKGTLVYDVMDPTVPKPTEALHFDSRFESGNLQLAVQISGNEYDLLLEPDINSVPGRHNQWFYFSVKNILQSGNYRFNILNMSKPTSQFNNGMQPVVYSIRNPGWKRFGENVSYIKYH
jgi:hypothetical protein